MNSIKENPQRSFFCLVSGTLFLLASWKFYQNRPPAYASLFVLGVLLLCVEFGLPKLANVLFLGWMKFAKLLSIVNTFFILSIIYFIAFVPVSLIKRLLRKPNAENRDQFLKDRSSWIALPGCIPPRESYFKPY